MGQILLQILLFMIESNYNCQERFFPQSFHIFYRNYHTENTNFYNSYLTEITVLWHNCKHREKKKKHVFPFPLSLILFKNRFSFLLSRSKPWNLAVLSQGSCVFKDTAILWHQALRQDWYYGVKDHFAPCITKFSSQLVLIPPNLTVAACATEDKWMKQLLKS